MRSKSKSIRTKYILSGLAICMISLILVSIFSYIVSYNITAEQSNMRIQEAALKNAAELDSWFLQNGKTVEGMVEDIEISGDYSDASLFKLVKGKVDIYNKDVLDYYIGFEDPERKMISGTSWVPDEGYDCRTRVWYKQALQSKGVVYTEPYVDAQTGKIVITISKVLKKDGKLIGVAAADIVITNVIDVVEKYNINQNSYAFLLDGDGNFIAHPNKLFAPDENGLKNIMETRKTDYSKLSSAMKGNTANAINMTDYDGNSKYFMISKINSCNWFFGIAVNQSEYKKPLDNLLYGFVIAILISILVGMGIMLKLTSEMVKPIKALSDTVKLFSTEDMSVRTTVNSEDEIGQLGKNFNHMAETIQEYSLSLERKVADRTKELKEKNDNIMESIDYAQRLQRAILPDLPGSLGIDEKKCFVIWKPRDIVGGDMYWCRGDESCTLLAIVDCTGHGVPGALMTMTVNSILDSLPRNLKDILPSEVLNLINIRLKETLRQENENSTADDGADIALCRIDKEHKKIMFSGAKLSMFVSCDGEVLEYKGVRSSVGYSRQRNISYEDYEIEWKDGSKLYFTTDGLLDQNIEEEKGGLGKKGFIELIQAICNNTLSEQKKTVEDLISERLLKVEQRDDITVLAIEM